MSVRRLVSGVEEPEGPVCLGEHGFLLVEMSRGRHSVVHVAPDGTRRDIAATGGRPNGLAVDGDGVIWVAEATEGALLGLSMRGEELCRIPGDADGRFLWPNDIALAPDGLLYMTDSGIVDRDFLEGLNIRLDFMEIGYDGRVYEIDAASHSIRRIFDRGLRFANGIAFGPDGLLYVAETLSGNIYTYDRQAERPERRLFGNCLVPDDRPVFKGPDGIKFGADGRLYCTIYGQGVIAVLDRSGTLVERLPTPGEKPTNLAFRRHGRDALVTEVSGSAVDLMPMPTEGLALHYPRGLVAGFAG